MVSRTFKHKGEVFKGRKPECLKYKKCRYFQSNVGEGRLKRFGKLFLGTFFTCGLGQFRFTNNIYNTKYTKCPLKRWWDI